MSLDRNLKKNRVTLVALVLIWLIGPLADAAPPIQVNSADPDTAERGTVNLNVKVKGKGFDSRAKAKFFKAGTKDPAGVTVNSTTFVSEDELVANIDVDETALLGGFDIEVQSRGRKGKGTDLFKVAESTSGNTIVTNVEMTTIEVSNGDSTTDLKVEVWYTNNSTQGLALVAVDVSIIVFAERCLDGNAGQFEANQSLDLEDLPQANCLRETYRETGTKAGPGPGGPLWVSFNDLPPGNYLFKIELGGDLSQNYSFRHGWALGRVD